MYVKGVLEAVKALSEMPKADENRFFHKIEIIAKDPYASLTFVKRLKGSGNFRFRFGNYRGVYTVIDRTLTITVIDIAHRREIYRR